MKINEFNEAVKEKWNKHFPNSLCICNFENSLYHSISIKCLIAGDKSEFANGIMQNDMLHVSFSIDTDKGEFDKEITANSELLPNLVLTCWHRNYLTVPTDKFLCYSSKQLPFRKTKGDAEKILFTLDKFFAMVHNELQQDLIAGNIHKNHIELLTKKLLG